MPNLPHDPMTVIPATPAPNADLPAQDFPTLARIQVIDRVGPQHANKQHKSLEKRDETLRDRVNKLIALANAIDTTYLRRDGSAQKDTVAGATGDIPLNNYKLTELLPGTDGTDATNVNQLNALAAVVATKAPINSPNLSGTPTAPTPGSTSDNTTIPTTEWVRDRLDEVSTLRVIKTSGAGVDQSWGGGTHPGGTSTLAVVYIPLVQVSTGRRLSNFQLETVASGNLDYDGGIGNRFVIEVVDAANNLVGASSQATLAMFTLLGIGTPYTPTAGMVRGDNVFANGSLSITVTQHGVTPGTGFNSNSAGYAGWLHFLLAAAHEALMVNGLKLKITYQGFGSFGNHPGGRVQAWY